MTTLQGTEARQYPLEQSESAIPKNSPFIYGLGTLSLSAIGQAFGGYYMFYYVDVLGLAVALATIVNVVYAIWDAVNVPARRLSLRQHAHRLCGLPPGREFDRLSAHVGGGAGGDRLPDVG